MNQRNPELDIDRLMHDNVSRYGFHVTGVLGDQFEPDYAYTVGFRIHEHPEVVCIGIQPREAAAAFNEIYRCLESDRMAIGIDSPNQLFGRPVHLLEVPREHFATTESTLPGIPRFLGFTLDDERWPPFVQLVWSDPDGRFPWEDGCDELVVRDQPILAFGDALVRRTPLAAPLDQSNDCILCRARAAHAHDEKRSARRAKKRRHR